MKRLLQRAYNMLQLCLQAMLCTVCLHAHDIMQDPFIGFPFYIFWIISQMCYHFCECFSRYLLFIYFFLIVVLHNSVLYASETTLQVGMKFCLVLAESLTELDTALHATSIKEQLPFLCNTD